MPQPHIFHFALLSGWGVILFFNFALYLEAYHRDASDVNLRTVSNKICKKQQEVWIFTANFLNSLSPDATSSSKT